MANNTMTTQRPQLITASNHGGYITITAALMTVWMALFYIIRIIVRLAFNNFFASDDIVVTIGTVFGIAQSIIAIIAVKAGIGSHIRTLASNKLNQAELTAYTADLLFIITICLAKISTSELIARLTRKKLHVIACRIISGIIILWGLASILTIGIGCHPSHPWDMVDRCPNLGISWVGIGIADVLIETTLIFLPVYLVWPLQMPTKTKLMVLLAFTCRVAIIPVAILRLLKFHSIQHSSDFTWDVVLAVVLGQVEMHFSLIAASIPCLRPFLNVWNTGYLATQVGQVDRTNTEQTAENSYALQSKTSTYTSKRNSMRDSFRNSSTVRHTSDISPQRPGDDTIHEDVVPRIPGAIVSIVPGVPDLIPPVPRKWKSPEELPVLDPYSAPTLTFTQHPRQWRKTIPEEPPLLKRSASITSASLQFEEALSKMSSDEFQDGRLVIHKTVAYEVTRSDKE